MASSAGRGQPDRDPAEHPAPDLANQDPANRDLADRDLADRDLADRDLADRDVADRALGALLGVHAGDALGATVEFMPWEAVRERHPDGVREIVGGGPFDWPAGHATDDTDLTRAVLLAYLEPGDDVVRTAADTMLTWFSGNWPGRVPGTRPRDVGAATAEGLTRYARSGDPRRAGAGRGRAGNGSLMRCMPTAIVRRNQPETRVLESVEISAITHDDPRCTAACAAYTEIAAALVLGADPGDAVSYGLALAEDLADRLGSETVVEAIRLGAGLSLPVMALATGPIDLVDAGGGFVLDSLSLAIAAVLDPRPLAEVLVDVVRLGNDADTNAAISGGLLGARSGASQIPQSWVRRLQFAEEFTAALPLLLG